MAHLLRPAALPALAVCAFVVGACGGDDTGETVKLDLVGRGEQIVIDDAGRRGPSIGDSRAFTQPLLDAKTRKPAGRIDGTATVTDRVQSGDEKVDYRFGTVQYTLDGGDIVAGGVYRAKPDEYIPAQGVTRPILGGTGRYRNAEGTVTQTPLPDGDIRNVLDVELDD